MGGLGPKLGFPADIAQGAQVLDVSSCELYQVPPTCDLVHVTLRCRKLEWCFAVGCVFWGLMGIGGDGTRKLFCASFILFLGCRTELHMAAVAKGEVTAVSLFLMGKTEKSKCGN